MPGRYAGGADFPQYFTVPDPVRDELLRRYLNNMRIESARDSNRTTTRHQSTGRNLLASTTRRNSSARALTLPGTPSDGDPFGLRSARRVARTSRLTYDDGSSDEDDRRRRMWDRHGYNEYNYSKKSRDENDNWARLKGEQNKHLEVLEWQRRLYDLSNYNALNASRDDNDRLRRLQDDLDRVNRQLSKMTLRELNDRPQQLRRGRSNISDQRDDPDITNILVLAEADIGKPSFINAFVNYLTYDSLAQALRRRDPQYVTPDEFSWHSLVGGDYKSNKVRVRPSRADLGGSVGVLREHMIQLEGGIVNLIETPSIGHDARNKNQNHDNLDQVENVINDLHDFGELNGVLILLQPNQANLSMYFTECLRELKQHLNRSAARNIIFAFLDSRYTNFNAGDGYTDLKRQVARSFSLDLNPQTTFFFDSEGYKCLAAHCDRGAGYEVENLGPYEQSWEQSAKEARRLLESFRLDPILRTRNRSASGRRNDGKRKRFGAAPRYD